MKFIYGVEYVIEKVTVKVMNVVGDSPVSEDEIKIAVNKIATHHNVDPSKVTIKYFWLREEAIG